MGNTSNYCESVTESNHGISHADTTAYSHCRPTHIKPSEPLKITGPVHADDDVEPIETTHREQRSTSNQKRIRKQRHPTFVNIPRARRRLPADTVETVFNATLKGLTNSSYSTGHLNKLCGSSQRRKSQHSNMKNTSTEKSQPKKKLTQSNIYNDAKLESFLSKQRDFVERRKRSIEKIRKLLEIKYDKQNLHQPRISEASLTIAKRKFQGSNRLFDHTISSSAMLERSINSNAHITESTKSKGHPRKLRNGSFDESCLVGSKLRETSPTEVTEQYICQLISELDKCIESMLITKQDAISYLLFVNIMRQLKMVTQQNDLENDVFIRERQLLHQAWQIITKRDNIDGNCTYRDILEFLLALYEYAVDDEGLPAKMSTLVFGKVNTKFGMFRCNRNRSPQMTCQNYGKSTNEPGSLANCQLIDIAPMVITKSCNYVQSVTSNQQQKPSKKTVPQRGKKPQKRLMIKSPQGLKNITYETFNTLNPISHNKQQNSGVNAESLCATRKAVQTQTIKLCRLEIDVDLGSKTEKIKVDQTEDPDCVAYEFLQIHRLPQVLKPKLADLIREGLAKASQIC